MLASCSQSGAVLSSVSIDDIVVNSALKSKAEECEYDFDPTKCVVEEKEIYDYKSSELKGINDYLVRPDINKVYIISGEYVEGYAGDYTPYRTKIYLWEDGLFSGKLADHNMKGYWFNSSKDSNHEVDTLVLKYMHSTYETTEVFNETEDPFVKECNAEINFNWGRRYNELKAFYYYPVIGISTDVDRIIEVPLGTDFHWYAEKINLYFVLKNLRYYKGYLSDCVKYRLSDPDMYDRSHITKTGECEIIIAVDVFETRVPIKVLQS